MQAIQTRSEPILAKDKTGELYELPIFATGIKNLGSVFNKQGVVHQIDKIDSSGSKIGEIQFEYIYFGDITITNYDSRTKVYDLQTILYGRPIKPEQ